jgi:pyrroloquinoline quinone biosynthesis protein E
MPDDHPHLTRGARLQSDPLTGEPVLLFPEGVLRLNKTAAEILALCDGRTSLQASAEILANRFGARHAAVLEDVTAFVHGLRGRGLLTGISLTGPDASAGTPGLDPGDSFPEHRPLGLLAELTYRCPLHCPYCSNPTRLPPGTELATAEWERVLAEAAAMGVLHVHFSGGEPLLRPDLPDLVRAAHAAGLYTNLLTSAIPLSRSLAERLRTAGLDHVQVSFQADEAVAADRLAGAAVHADKLAAARLVREFGWPLTVNVVLHRDNIGRVPALVALAEEVGADRLELANVQFYGWGHENRTALLPDRAAIEAAGREAAAARERLRGRMEVLYVVSDSLAERPKACMGGWGRRYLTVNPTGDVLPCPTAGCIPSLRFENVRQSPLRWIWDESEAFNRFRGIGWMPQPCRGCDRREVDFGGCRCQAFLLTGEAANTDPACALSPHRHLLPQGTPGRGEELIPLRPRILRANATS